MNISCNCTANDNAIISPQSRRFVLDLDGTLIYSLDDLGKSLNYALAEYQFPTHEENMIRAFIGNGSKNFITRGLGEERRKNFDEVYALFERHYGEHCTDSTIPYEGAVEFLQEHSGHCAVLTNKPAAWTHKILRHFNLEKHLAGVLGGDDTPARKPEADGLLKIIKDANWSAEQVLMVGDDTPDIGAAKNAGVKIAVILGGYGVPETLLSMNPDYAFNSFEEFRKWENNL